MYVCVSAGKVSPPSPGDGGETFFLHVSSHGVVSPLSPSVVVGGETIST